MTKWKCLLCNKNFTETELSKHMDSKHPELDADDTLTKIKRV